jgi:hypothetical protein
MFNIITIVPNVRDNSRSQKLTRIMTTVMTCVVTRVIPKMVVASVGQGIIGRATTKSSMEILFHLLCM